MIHVTEILTHYIAKLQYEDLPQEVVKITKMYILDYYAACFAGKKINRKFNNIIENIFFETAGREESSVLCSNLKLPVGNAAFLNAIYAHGADMDDGNRKAMGHVAAHVMSTIFALSETLEVSGKDIITAINVGYEVYNRVAAAVQPGLVRRGFHSTGTAGAIACGAASAKLMGLDEKRIYNSISLSAIQASGLLLITESGQSCKPINPANAARSGILAAQLAQKGVESSTYPLESSKGWFHAMSDFIDENAVLDGLGKQFTICESYLKPYPSCRHTHCGIDAALKIRQSILRKYKIIECSNIEQINLYVYQNAIRVAGNIQIPQSDEECKFSMHYTLAVALWRGHFELGDLDASNIDFDILDIIGKIRIVFDESMENLEEGIRGARIRLVCKDEEVFEECIKVPKGDATNPFTMQELQEKLEVCANDVITAKQYERLILAVESFEKIEKYCTINHLFECEEKE